MMNPFKRIMLVDDDLDDQEIFLVAVAKISPSISCITAGDGLDAIEKLNNKETLPQVIFLDLNMPRMNGFQFLEEVKNYEDLSHIPIVILSTSSDPRAIVETKAMGAKGFITKPCSLEDWMSKLQSVLRNKDLRVV